MASENVGEVIMRVRHSVRARETRRERSPAMKPSVRPARSRRSSEEERVMVSVGGADAVGS